LCDGGQSAFSQGMARPPLVTPAGITDGFSRNDAGHKPSFIAVDMRVIQKLHQQSRSSCKLFPLSRDTQKYILKVLLVQLSLSRFPFLDILY